jgi:spore coat polysaccharide biosynthesis protein SpsF
MEVSFRAIERKDLELVRGWRNQDRIRRNSRDHRVFNQEDQLSWFQKISHSRFDDVSIVLEGNIPVGVCGLTRIDPDDRSAEITYYLGEQKNAVRDVAVGVAAYEFLKRKGFEEYKLKRLYGEAFAFNEGGIKLACYCGFKKEKIKANSIYLDGQYWDGVIVCMWAEEYRAQKGLNVVIIVQARTGSTRLPNKILKEVMGKPLLEYLLERLKRVKKADTICVATTTKPQERPILDICSRMSVGTFRGSEEDVLERYFLAAQEWKADAVVRITSDCPLIDPVEINKLIEYYIDHVGKYDYVSHSLERSYPAGMEAEIFSFEVLEKANQEAKSGPEREHVTLYFRERPEVFRLANLAYKEDQKDYRWTVDTPEDFELVAKIIENLYSVNPEFSLDDILDLCQKNPGWRNINSHITQKAAG